MQEQNTPMQEQNTPQKTNDTPNAPKNTPKISTRLICIIVAAVVVIGAVIGLIIGLSGGDPSTTTTRRPGGTGEGKWDGVSFEGETLRIEYNSHVQPTLSATGSPHYYEKFIQGPDSASSDPVDNAVFERNELVADRLGMEIEWMEDKTSAVNELFSHFESIAGAGNAPHIVINMNYGLIRAEVGGLLYNLKKDYGDTSKNYFAFEGEDAEGWYMDMMLDTTLNKDRIYIAAGDYLIDPLRLSYNTFVNTNMFEENFKNRQGMDYLYDLVIGGTDWTYDTFMELNEVVTDQTSQDEDRWTYGVSTNTFSYRAFFFSSGLSLFDYDETGKPSYTTKTETLNDLHQYVDDITDVLAAPGVAGPNMKDFSAQKSFDLFKNGNALFMTDQFLASLEGQNFREMDHATAVIPYPKYNYEADYRILVSDNACSGGILISSLDDEFAMASAFLQMMTEESEDVLYEYFEKGLKSRDNAANDPRQVQVLDIIRDAVAEPLDFLFDNFSSRETPGTHGTSGDSHTIYDIIEEAVKGGIGSTNPFSSTWGAEAERKNNTLQQTVARFYED